MCEFDSAGVSFDLLSMKNLSCRVALLIILSCCLQSFLHANTWTTLVGGGSNDEAWSVSEAKNGGFFVSGWTVNDQFYRDILLVKLDFSGNVEWKRRLNTGLRQFLFPIVSTSDGGFVAVSSPRNIMKFDASGALQWQTARLFQFGIGEISAVRPMKGGGYIAAGHNNGHPVLIQLDSNGNILKSRQYTRSNRRETIQFLLPAPNGGWLLAGRRSNSTSGRSEILLLRVNSQGAVLWKKTYRAVSDGVQIHISKTPEGGYLIAADATILKLDGDGKVVWQKTYTLPSGSFRFVGIDALKSGEYIVGNYNGTVLLLNSNGDVRWVRKFKYKNASGIVNGVRKTKDSGFIVFGTMRSPLGAGRRDAWILKLNRDGNTTGSCIAGREFSNYTVTSESGEITTFTGISFSAISIGFESLEANISDFSGTENLCRE
jgi:hypothetical protein